MDETKESDVRDSLGMVVHAIERELASFPARLSFREKLSDHQKETFRYRFVAIRSMIDTLETMVNERLCEL